MRECVPCHIHTTSCVSDHPGLIIICVQNNCLLRVLVKVVMPYVDISSIVMEQITVCWKNDELLVKGTFPESRRYPQENWILYSAFSVIFTHNSLREMRSQQWWWEISGWQLRFLQLNGAAWSLMLVKSRLRLRTFLEYKSKWGSYYCGVLSPKQTTFLSDHPRQCQWQNNTWELCAKQTILQTHQHQTAFWCFVCLWLRLPSCCQHIKKGRWGDYWTGKP